MQGQANNLGRGPLGVPTNSPVSDAGTSARIQNRPNVPIGTTAPHHDGGKPSARLGGNKEQGTERFPLLKLGARGNDVQRLQRLLNLHLDNKDQLKVDGNFGPKTRDAVIEFQKDEELKRDGVVGRDTWFSLISAGTQETSWKAKPPAAPTKVVATPTTTATKKTVDQWTLTERFEYVLKHCGPYLGPDLRAQFAALLTPVNLGIMVGSLVVWAAGHFFGVSEIADAFLLGFGLVFLGKAAIDAARLLKNVIEITCSASTENELEDAAKDLAEAIAIIGVMAFFALLAKVGRAIGNKLKAAKAAGEGAAKPPQPEPEPAAKASPPEKSSASATESPSELPPANKGAGKGRAAIKNKRDGLAREKKTEAELKEKHGDDAVQSEQYLRDKNGKIAKDPLTGEARRVDHVVIKDGKAVESVETTSMTADKAEQIAKEGRIREGGGTFVRDRNTGQLVDLSDTPTRLERKP